MFHYPITLSILALQLPLTSTTASHNLCHHLNTVYDNILINCVELQIPFYGFLNPRGELLVYSVYLILLPYKKWNPNNYIKIHIH
ncbi:EM14S01-3B_G0019370.mRNA.1.CDS.1 [Saccharomyces cerevisiae]|nr:EM14S01-3B_G0019370.mRNA.1.CDS.1 [Saccharomyces cerevisiae]